MKQVLANALQHTQVVDRLILRLASNTSSSLCMLIEQLPLFFRVTAIESTYNGHAWVHIAEIYNEKASLRVQWTSSNKINIQLNQLVSIRWKGQTICEQGAIHISRLVTQHQPPKGLNLLC